MSLLLDTHVLLWWLTDDAHLPERMRTAIANTDADVLVSAVSAWELSIKSSVGKLNLPDGLPERLQEEGFTTLTITVEDGVAAGALPRHHADPFDRMLIAQAARRDLTLLTVDRRFSAYDVRLL
ncbi:type II toxin-antitoxin system VapC family toxin [Kineococcus sp. LSe6-4]|uniref:Type II toxin-antitoxin system VapC family toxin n=1 Tax=Kineococcus halophytocola TaxID=3234027 RepID=A0ABV4GZY9_9ACTN